jgi:hypothetical protein
VPAFYFVLQEKISGVDATGLGGLALSKHSKKFKDLNLADGLEIDPPGRFLGGR